MTKTLHPGQEMTCNRKPLNKLYAASERVNLCNDKPLQHDWLMLQSSDHFRYMSYKDPYGTNYESAYRRFYELYEYLGRLPRKS